MIHVEGTDVYGWEAAIRGMRNPYMSHDKSDSAYVQEVLHDEYDLYLVDTDAYEVGQNDIQLMQHLVAAGTDHWKFMRFVNVTCDIVAPLYWWKEFDTYKVGTVANSCSTMHTINAKEFTLGDFSHEHLLNDGYITNKSVDDESVCLSPLDTLKDFVFCLNVYREKYLETNDKKWWWQMIQLLPSSYNQRRTVQVNYSVLRNMYHARKEHKLDEWRDFCQWVENLPYAKELICCDGKEIEETQSSRKIHSKD